MTLCRPGGWTGCAPSFFCWSFPAAVAYFLRQFAEMGSSQGPSSPARYGSRKLPKNPASLEFQEPVSWFCCAFGLRHVGSPGKDHQRGRRPDCPPGRTMNLCSVRATSVLFWEVSLDGCVFRVAARQTPPRGAGSVPLGTGVGTRFQGFTLAWSRRPGLGSGPGQPPWFLRPLFTRSRARLRRRRRARSFPHHPGAFLLLSEHSLSPPCRRRWRKQP